MKKKLHAIVAFSHGKENREKPLQMEHKQLHTSDKPDIYFICLFLFIGCLWIFTPIEPLHSEDVWS